MMLLKGHLDDNAPMVDRTMYQRFKEELQKDDDGNLLHMDFLTDKFKDEFDNQSAQSEIRRKNSIN
jgi:hypothetical protein